MTRLTATTPEATGVEVSDNDALNAALVRAAREASLTHARVGRSVPVGSGNGGVVWVTPAEIFARYGLDEFGRLNPATPALEADAGRQE